MQSDRRVALGRQRGAVLDIPLGCLPKRLHLLAADMRKQTNLISGTLYPFEQGVGSISAQPRLEISSVLS